MLAAGLDNMIKRKIKLHKYLNLLYVFTEKIYYIVNNRYYSYSA